jgi:hypothetical protein
LLLQTGLLYPELPPGDSEFDNFESWIGAAGVLQARVFAHPGVMARARGEELGLPDLASGTRQGAEKGVENTRSTLGTLTGAARLADGLDWPLRLAVVWQQVSETPVRLTQTNTLFKRDLNRLQADELLAAPAPDQLAGIPEPGVLALFWAQAAGLLSETDNELRAVPFPPAWDDALAPTLADLWAGLLAVEPWDPLHGYTPADTGLAAAPTAGMLALLLLANADAANWLDAQPIADWLWEHHPSWPATLPAEETKTRGRRWVEAFLLGVAYPLRLVEAAQHDGWKVRLTDLGRHLLAGAPEPAPTPTFPQTLLVQPNAEVLAYRQGLTPGLVAKLSRFAKWKGLGPACTLELNPTQTYHGLESGLSLAGMLQTLNQHGMKPVPPAVADLLRRWSDKRERITVYASATLVEFQSPADLEAAVARGVVSVRVTDRIGLSDDGREPDFKHLRLVGNRDYEARPTRCVTVAGDGVTLTVDSAQSDLLLEAEIGRLAEPLTGDAPGVRRFRLTPESLRRAIESGYTLSDLDAWFDARAGHPLTPAGRLFVLGPSLPPPTAARHLVVRLPSAEVTDGLMQWPPTAALVDERLGPTAVTVDEANLPQLKSVLDELGIVLT